MFPGVLVIESFDRLNLSKNSVVHTKMWAKFKNLISGMTEEERDINELDRDLWRLEHVIAWNAEIGRKFFPEDAALRAQATALKNQIASLRRRLPMNSQLKSGPWVNSPWNNSYFELYCHVRYLEEVLELNRGNMYFPSVEISIRLRILSEQLRMMQPPMNFIADDWRSHHSQRWNPAVPMYNPPGWGPAEDRQPGWGPPVDDASPFGPKQRRSRM